MAVPPPPPGNRPTFLDFPLFLGVFQWDEPTKRVSFTAEPEIPEILTKWKAPYKDLTETGNRARKVSGTQGRDRGDKWKHRGQRRHKWTQHGLERLTSLCNRWLLLRILKGYCKIGNGFLPGFAYQSSSIDGIDQ